MAEKEPKTPKRGRGRPKLELNAECVEMLAGFFCTVEEIAAVLGCDKKTLERNFVASLEKGREVAKSSLRRAQWAAAVEGNPTMLIWLGKQYLGQRDKSDVTSDGLAVKGYVGFNPDNV